MTDPLIEKSAGKPINKTASLVVGKGTEYVGSKRFNQEIWTAGPPPVIEPSHGEDLRGTSRGRMTVFGYFNRFMLVCRCVCGNYELRRADRWRDGLRKARPDSGCQYYIETEYLRNKDHFRRHGKDRDE